MDASSKYSNLSADQMRKLLHQKDAVIESTRVYAVKNYPERPLFNSTNFQSPPTTPVGVQPQTSFQFQNSGNDDAGLMDSTTTTTIIPACVDTFCQKDANDLEMIPAIYLPDMNYGVLCVEPNGTLVPSKFDFEFDAWGVNNPTNVLNDLSSGERDLDDLPEEIQNFSDEIFERLGRLYPYLIDKVEQMSIVSRFEALYPKLSELCDKYIATYSNDATKKNEVYKIRNITFWINQKIFHKFKIRAEKLRPLRGVWPNEKKQPLPKTVNLENRGQSGQPESMTRDVHAQSLPIQHSVTAQDKFRAALEDAIGSSSYQYVRMKPLMDLRSEKIKEKKAQMASQAAQKKKLKKEAEAAAALATGTVTAALTTGTGVAAMVTGTAETETAALTTGTGEVALTPRTDETATAAPTTGTGVAALVTETAENETAAPTTGTELAALVTGTSETETAALTPRTDETATAAPTTGTGEVELTPRTDETATAAPTTGTDETTTAVLTTGTDECLLEEQQTIQNDVQLAPRKRGRPRKSNGSTRTSKKYRQQPALNS